MTWVIGVQGAILTVLTIINLLAAIWIFVRIRSSIHRIAMLGFGGPILLLILFVVPAQIAWPWYVLIGTIVTIAVANTVASLGKSQ
jgi:hypothetical protein